MFRLIIKPGRPDERAVDVSEGRTTIGSGESVDIRVEDGSISAVHAALDLSKGVAILTDLESESGAYLGGERIDANLPELVEDLFRLGDVHFALVAVEVDQGQGTARYAIDAEETDLTTRSIDDLLGTRFAAEESAADARVLAAERRARDRLEILLKVSQILSTPEKIDRCLERVLDLVFQILAVDRAAILMVEENELVPRVVKTGEAGFAGDERVFSHKIVNHVRQERQAVLFADAASGEEIDVSESIVQQSIRSSMGAPLMTKGEVIGVLYVDNLSLPNVFGEDDVRFLSAFASQAAVAIENARLYERLEGEAVKRDKLSRFFPPSAVGEILGNERLIQEPVDAEVTVLFSDISGFTAMSSRMTPREVLLLLNEYFPNMADIVFKYEGTLEKYIGDALLAVWGAPIPHDDDADRALRAAVDMQRALRALNSMRGSRHHIQIHIGLNSGMVAAGGIGSADSYMQYATIGDATNVAARVCNVATDGQVLIHETTRLRLQSEWPLHPIDPVAVKGKDEPLLLHRVDWEAIAR